MIYPNMATMLAFLTCDAGIQKEEWDKMIAIAVKKSFNAISVDGETSTNDSFVGINAGEKIEKRFFPIIQKGLILYVRTWQKILQGWRGSKLFIRSFGSRSKKY